MARSSSAFEARIVAKPAREAGRAHPARRDGRASSPSVPYFMIPCHRFSAAPERADFDTTATLPLAPSDGRFVRFLLEQW